MKKRNRVLILSLLAFMVQGWAYSIWGQGSAEAGQKAEMPEEPLLVRFKKTVSFLQVWYEKNGVIEVIRGTCFFLSVEDERLPKGRSFGYLVTNRHMVEPRDERDHVLRVVKMSLRLNLKNAANGSQSEEKELPRDLKWYFHPDDSVDLAAMPFIPDDAIYDFFSIPLSDAATKDVIEERRISEGDKVVYTGYFSQYSGESKIQPVVREGIIAMMPDERLPTTLNKPGHVYLADVHVFGGNSGSPVLVSLSGFRGGAVYFGGEYRLLVLFQLI